MKKINPAPVITGWECELRWLTPASRPYLRAIGKYNCNNPHESSKAKKGSKMIGNERSVITSLNSTAKITQI